MKEVIVIGAGLAGSEASYQLAKRGYLVKLYEMRPKKMTPAHKTEMFSELICSNSLRAAQIENAVGLLKEEMRMLGSLIMEAADYSRVEAGGALAVDRDVFAGYITDKIKNHPNITIINEEITKIPTGNVIVASGPLTSDALSKSISEFLGKDYLYFFDAVAPIVTAESIDKNIAYLKSRYDKGEASYYNCPMTKEQFEAFYHELINGDKVIPHDFELKVFEGCMAIEDIAARGRQTLLFGPLKPVGLRHPETLVQPYAVVQLRPENKENTLYNLVGFQTHLKWPEQKRIFRMIPGLENVEIVRYGVMHRNTFINSPGILNKYYQAIKRENLFFAGQITGVEGYLESASSGCVAAINMSRFLNDKPMVDFTRKTALGALSNYISTPNPSFQPMNVIHGIFEPLPDRMKKKDRKLEYANRSISFMKEIVGEINADKEKCTE